MMEKIYFVEYSDDDFIIHAYVGFARTLKSRDDHYKYEGYTQCLVDLGYSYGGDFRKEEEYIAKFKK